jgi:TrmH family RNA methyltransferase
MTSSIGDIMKFSDLTYKDNDERAEIIASFVKDLTSAAKTNDTIKHMRDILKGKGDQSEAVVTGISMIESITKYDLKIECLVICSSELFTERAQKAAYEASLKAEKVFSVSPATFSLIANKKNSNGLAVLIKMPYKKIGDIKPHGINLVLDSLELPGNVGTLMRTADAAGLDSVIITNPKVRLNNPTMMAASRASFAKLNIVVDSVDNIADWAKKNGIDIILADTDAEYEHTDANFKGRVMFVVGCERYGIDPKWYEKEHRLVKIPMLGECDSLNVGVAGSIFVYEALRQQRKG